jgi:hypothetical protein
MLDIDHGLWQGQKMLSPWSLGATEMFSAATNSALIIRELVFGVLPISASHLCHRVSDEWHPKMCLIEGKHHSNATENTELPLFL